MKEDAQLVCPVAVDDSTNAWSLIESLITDRLPLRDVTWRSPLSSAVVTVEKLPLRFLPATAKLFNETDHPYRRFLAPYMYLYILCAETLEEYKAAKVPARRWMESHQNMKSGRRNPWAVVYIACSKSGSTTPAEVYNKIYHRVCSDFCVERAGDHSVMIVAGTVGSGSTLFEEGSKNVNSKRRFTALNRKPSLPSPEQQTLVAVTDLLVKLRHGVLSSFHNRTLQYDSLIRTLDGHRGTPQFDFWQLFLVKESLALMYQMMQQPGSALAQYEELDALLQFAPKQSLPVTDWPMVRSADSSNKKTSGETTLGDAQQPLNENSERNHTSSRPSSTRKRRGSKRLDLFSDAFRLGEEVVQYSINQARMNILWNKFSMPMLQNYIFARRFYFLKHHLQHPVKCGECALSYLTACDASLREQVRISCERSNMNGSNEIQVENRTGNEFDAHPLLLLRQKQVDVWLLVATVKLIYQCRQLTKQILHGTNSIRFQPGESNKIIDASSASMDTSVSLKSAPPTGDISSIGSMSLHGTSSTAYSLASLSRAQFSRPGAHNIMDISVSSAISSMSAAVVGAGQRDALYSMVTSRMTILRESSAAIEGLLDFASTKLEALTSELTFRYAAQSSMAITLQHRYFSSGETHQSTKCIDDLSDGTFGHTASYNGNITIDPRNVDVLNSLEHELETLVQLRGVRTPEDQLDQVLSNLPHKIKTTSHYWSRLYDISQSSNTSTDNVSAAAGADTIINQEESITGTHRRNTRRHSLSQMQIERGKLLELSLLIMNTTAQWEVQLLSNRPRIALYSVVRSADLLMSQGHFAHAACRFEIALDAGFVAPAIRCEHIGITNICKYDAVLDSYDPSIALENDQCCLHNNLVSTTVSLEGSPDTTINCSHHREIWKLMILQSSSTSKSIGGTGTIESSEEHEKSEDLFNGNMNSVSTTADASFGIGDTFLGPGFDCDLTESTASSFRRACKWITMYYWICRKLICCYHYVKHLEHYRVAACKLLMCAGGDMLLAEHNDSMKSIFYDVLYLSGRFVPSFNSELVDEELREEKSEIMQCQHILRLPLLCYFDLCIVHTDSQTASNEIPSVAANVNGFEVFQDEWFPVSALQYTAGHPSGYGIDLEIESFLPATLPVDRFEVYFRKLDINQLIHDFDLSTQHSQKIVCDSPFPNNAAIGFYCHVAATEEGDAGHCLHPGKQRLRFTFSPPEIGEYCIDHIFIISGTLEFHVELLPTTTTAVVSNAMQTALGGSKMNVLGDQVTAEPASSSLPTNNVNDCVGELKSDDVERPPMQPDLNESDRATIRSNIIRSFFRKHPIVRIISPINPLQACLKTVGSIMPYDQLDDAYFFAQTAAHDLLEDLQIKFGIQSLAESNRSLPATPGKHSPRDNCISSNSPQYREKNSSFRFSRDDCNSEEDMLEITNTDDTEAGFVTQEAASPLRQRRNKRKQLRLLAAATKAAGLDSIPGLTPRTKMDRGVDIASAGAVYPASKWTTAAYQMNDIRGELVMVEENLIIQRENAEENSNGIGEVQSIDNSTVQNADNHLSSSNATLCHIFSNRQLHLRMPFLVTSSGESIGNDDSVDKFSKERAYNHRVESADQEFGSKQILLKAEVKGTLIRSSCRIPLDFIVECPVTMLSPMELIVENLVTVPTIPELAAASHARAQLPDDRPILNLFAQCVLRNRSQEIFNLTACSVVSVDDAQKKESCMAVLVDGPRELSSNTNISTRTSPVEGHTAIVDERVAEIILPTGDIYPAAIQIFVDAEEAIKTQMRCNSGAIGLRFQYKRRICDIESILPPHALRSVGIKELERLGLYVRRCYLVTAPVRLDDDCVAYWSNAARRPSNRTGGMRLPVDVLTRLEAAANTSENDATAELMVEALSEKQILENHRVAACFDFVVAISATAGDNGASLPVLRCGELNKMTYSLKVLRLPVLHKSEKHQQLRTWSEFEQIIGDACVGHFATVKEVLGLQQLEVQIHDTQHWITAGIKNQKLIDCKVKVKDSRGHQERNGSTYPIDWCGKVSVEFDIEMELLPLTAGCIPFPSLQVIYCAKGDEANVARSLKVAVSANGSECVEVATVLPERYPDVLKSSTGHRSRMVRIS